MFGSDWPVTILNGEYASVWREIPAVLAEYSQPEQDAILGGTAAVFYRL